MRRLILVVYSAFILVGCGKPNPNIVVPPEKTALISPAKDELCIVGALNAANENIVTFKWANAPHAESYDLVITDLITKTVTTTTVVGTSKEIALRQNNPYSWYIVSRSSKTPKKVESDTWKFYSSGLGISNYAPYPASIIAPKMAEVVNGDQITLEWQGLDVDKDIESYSVYLGTTAQPPLFKDKITQSTLTGITLQKNATYYWKVVTIDKAGNTSESVVYKFSVQ